MAHTTRVAHVTESRGDALDIGRRSLDQKLSSGYQTRDHCLASFLVTGPAHRTREAGCSPVWLATSAVAAASQGMLVLSRTILSA